MKAKFPEGAIKKIEGKCIVLRGDDIDTDRIIPARFLKCVSFRDLGNQVFADDRTELNGSHPFDILENQGSSLLIVNKNFGCGSSREHAPQALMRWGIRGVIGESYAEIFYGNCLALGIPCATAPESTITEIQNLVDKNPHQVWILDIKNSLFKNDNNEKEVLLQTGPQEMLATGQWDATSQLISHSKKLDDMSRKLPYLNDFEQSR